MAFGKLDKKLNILLRARDISSLIKKLKFWYLKSGTNLNLITHIAIINQRTRVN